MTTKRKLRPSGVTVHQNRNGTITMRSYGPNAPDLRNVVPGLLAGTRSKPRTQVTRFCLQPTASFPEVAPQREEYVDDRAYDRACVKYANEWRAMYRCAGCDDVACPQCGAEGAP